MIDERASQAAGYACSTISILVILLRLILGRLNKSPFDTSFFLCIASLLVAGAREATSTYLLYYGTANDAANESPDMITAQQEANIKTGTILTLCSRMLLTTFYWLQVSLLLLFYTKFVSHFTPSKFLIRLCWATIMLTYIAALLTTFLECHPFSLYWTIIPHPNTCVHAYVQLFTQGIANIILDLELLIIAYPILNVRGRTVKQHFLIGFLFLMGTLCIAVTCIRLAVVVDVNSNQAVRSVWGSIQVMLCSLVANIPAIYGAFNILNRKRSGPCPSRNASWFEMNDEILPVRQQANAQFVAAHLESFPPPQPRSNSRTLQHIPDV